MEEHVQLSELLAGLLEDLRDVFIPGDVAWQNERVSAERPRQFLNVLLQPFALIRKGKLRASLRPRLRNRPGDRAFVRHAKNHSELIVQNSRHADALSE